MISDSKCINDFFTYKEIFPIWNLSMMTQRDEINYDKHLNMNYPEFVEAICRVADKLGIPNIAEDTIEHEDWTNPQMVAKWRKQPLC